jgi:hypothetical protein
MNVYVLTSNNYLHCLPPFAFLFNKFWSDTQAVTVVGYDQRPPALPRNFQFMSLGKQEDYTWSQGIYRFCEAIQGVDTWPLIMLEDYFISQPVDVGRIESLFNLMRREHPAIAKIDLTDDRLKVAHEKWYEGGLLVGGLGLIRSADDAPFQTSTQAAIWRRDFLAQFLEDSENPWQYERKGSKRVIAARKAGTFTGHILGCENPPLVYVNAKGGEGTQPDQWARKRFPDGLWNELSVRGLLD